MHGSLVIGLFTVLLVPMAAQAEAIRCGTKLAQVGDTALTLRSVCGDPDHVEVRTTTRLLQWTPAQTRTLVSRTERWIYGSEEGQLGRLVRIERGVIQAIDTLSAPARPTEAHLDRCRRMLFSEGRATTGEVRLTCGSPDQVDTWYEQAISHLPSGEPGVFLNQTQLVTYERWTYDFGSNQFLRLLTFANGKLIDRDRGERGSRR